MSAAVPERVELDQAFKPFLHGVKEIRPPRSQGPSLFYGTSRILSAPDLPDLLFRGVIGWSRIANSTRKRQRLWIEADHDYLAKSGLVLLNKKLRLHYLDLNRLPGIEDLKTRVLMPYGTYEAGADQSSFHVGGNIKFMSFIHIVPGSQPGPHLTADPYNEEWLMLIEAKFILAGQENPESQVKVAK